MPLALGVLSGIVAYLLIGSFPIIGPLISGIVSGFISRGPVFGVIGGLLTSVIVYFLVLGGINGLNLYSTITGAVSGVPPSQALLNLSSMLGVATVIVITVGGLIGGFLRQ